MYIAIKENQIDGSSLYFGLFIADSLPQKDDIIHIKNNRGFGKKFIVEHREFEFDADSNKCYYTIFCYLGCEY